MRQKSNSIAEASHSISNDFRSLINHTEQLLQATASASGEGVDLIRERINDSLARAKARLAALEDDAVRKGRMVVAATTRRVRDRPWQSLAIAALCGAVFAMIARRSPASTAQT